MRLDAQVKEKLSEALGVICVQELRMPRAVCVPCFFFHHSKNQKEDFFQKIECDCGVIL